MIIVKGVNVYPSALESLLHRVGGLSEHYELHVDRDVTNDFVTVKAEARPEIDEAPLRRSVPRRRGGDSIRHSASASASPCRNPGACRATS
jgi:phenylacetate-CoA ligase